MSVAGVVLAAGRGSRLGGKPKALLPYRGRPLVNTVAEALSDGGCQRIFVVVGAYAESVAQACGSETSVVFNPDWEVGMSTSFRCGVDAAVGFETVVLTVVDFPGITMRLVRSTLAAHRLGTITVAELGGRSSHPVVFDANDARLAATEAAGDEGARSFISRNRTRVRRFDGTNLAEAGDIDTADDLWRLT